VLIDKKKDAHRDSQGHFGKVRIANDMYDKKLKEYKEKQQDLFIQMEEHSKADENFYLTASKVLNLASRALQIFESSEVTEKRALLNFVLQNPVLSGRNLLLKNPKIMLIGKEDDL